MAPGITCGRVEPKDHPKQSHWVHPVFLVHCAEAVLPTDLEYGSPRVRGYDEDANQEPARTHWTSWMKRGSWP
jgi:hypothetical protein